MTDDMSSLQGNERHDRLAPLAKQIHEPAFGVTARTPRDGRIELRPRHPHVPLESPSTLRSGLSTFNFSTFDF